MGAELNAVVNLGINLDHIKSLETLSKAGITSENIASAIKNPGSITDIITIASTTSLLSRNDVDTTALTTSLKSIADSGLEETAIDVVYKAFKAGETHKTIEDHQAKNYEASFSFVDDLAHQPDFDTKADLNREVAVKKIGLLEGEWFSSDLALEGNQASQKNALVELMATLFSDPTIQNSFKETFGHNNDGALKRDDITDHIKSIELGPNGINVTVTPDFEGFYKGLNPKEQTAIQDAIREQFNSLHKEGVKQYKDTHKEHGGVDDIYKAAKSFDSTLEHSSKYNPFSSEHEKLVGAELQNIKNLEYFLKVDQKRVDSLGEKLQNLEDKVKKAVEKDRSMRGTGLSDGLVKEEINAAINNDPELSAQRRRYEGVQREHNAIELERQEIVARLKSIAVSRIELHNTKAELVETNQSLDKNIGALTSSGRMPGSTSLLTKFEKEVEKAGMGGDLVGELQASLAQLESMNHKERHGAEFQKTFEGLTKSFALIEVLAKDQDVGKKVQSMAKEINKQLEQITKGATEVVNLEKDIRTRANQTNDQIKEYSEKRSEFGERVKTFADRLNDLNANSTEQIVDNIKTEVLDKVTEALNTKKKQIAQKVENALGAPDGADVADTDRKEGGMNKGIKTNLEALKKALEQDPEAADALNNKGTKMDNKYGNARPTNAADPARTTGDNDRNR